VLASGITWFQEYVPIFITTGLTHVRQEVARANQNPGAQLQLTSMSAQIPLIIHT
jgi:hypothetical protein